MENRHFQKISAIALGAAFGYEPLITVRIIRETGSPEAVFKLSEKERDALLGPFSKFRGKLSDAALEAAEKELAGLERRGLRFIDAGDSAFPPLLRECDDCPAGLYVRSDSSFEELFLGRPCISVIGTRDLSAYGREWTGNIVEALSNAPEKPVIVSGLAFGVDITAHLAALEFGLPTIGVLPTGIDEVYPHSHTQAARRIATSPGSALVTDFAPGTRPVAVTFLRRNRIIAGMSAATIITESKVKGGGMMTARLAFGYGRDVFALPGRIDDPRSSGCNLLIREKTAEPVTDLQCLCEAIGLGGYNRRRKADLAAETADFYRDSPDTEELVRLAVAIKADRGIDTDTLCAETGIPFARAASLLSRLECDGFICRDLIGRCSVRAR